MTKRQIQKLEKELERFDYDEIPTNIIKLIENKFDTYSYLMSIIEIKKQSMRKHQAFQESVLQ